MDTDRLIQYLAENIEPVRPLPHPLVRTFLWLAIALPYVGLVVLVVSPRDDLLAKFSDLRYIVEQLAALATGIAAAVAAFTSVIPAVSRKFLFLPLFPLAVWIGSLGEGCVESWLRYGSNGLSLQPDWFCFPAIVLVGTIPAIAMIVMLRRGVPLAPTASAALGGLAAAGLGNFGLRFFHQQDASVMVLVWQVGTVVTLSVLAGVAGHYLLDWRSLAGTARGHMTIEHAR